MRLLATTARVAVRQTYGRGGVRCQRPATRPACDDDPVTRPGTRTAVGVGTAVGVWLASRVALVGFVLGASALMGVDAARRAQAPADWVLQRFVWWDSLHFVRIADTGYLPPGLPCCDQAYFPGYPLLIALARPLTGDNTRASALAVTAVAGLAAAVLLWHLARERIGPRGATTAVVLLAVAPYGLFFTVAYSESLFLALSLGAWWAAARRRWWVAGLLTTGAAVVRVNGLFLLAGLLVMYAGQLRRDGRVRPRTDLLALLLPVLAVGAWVGYLAHLTGSWNAWQQAQAVGWERRTAWPWQGIAAGWAAIGSATTTDLVVARWADLAFVLAGLALLAVLLGRRHWPEATYVGLSVGVLVCSTLIVSTPRYALTWFPGYLLLAELLHRPGWRWVRFAVPLLCLPALGWLAVSFARHRWVA